ncbi:hypothetical protein JCM11491_001212 [Sporobolomyces phaffii]
MDHGGHNMPGMPSHGLPCSMNMVFNADPVGVCLVFESLQIRTASQVLPYLLLVTVISIFCEWVRLSLQSFDRQLRSQYRGGAFQPSTIPPHPSSSSGMPASGISTPRVGLGLNTPGGRRVGMSTDGTEETLIGRGARTFGTVRLPWSIQTRRSLFYVVHVALTFYIMLLVMSYNLQIIASILIGAFVGHFTFQRNFDLGGGADELESKGINCH